jgi:hypothetical protein
MTTTARASSADRPPPEPEGDLGPSPRPTSAAPGTWEVALFALATVLVASLRLALVGGPQLTVDSYQYLSVAENLREHGTASTSIVHFDVERAHGTVPAPATTFAAGYPVVVWLLSAVGFGRESAALLVSMASAIAVVLLLRAAGTSLQLTPMAIRAVLCGWAFSAQAARYATTALAESLFTAVTLGALVLLIPAARGATSAWRPIVGGALVGAAYHVRYAGLLLVAAFLLCALVEIARGRMRRTWLAAAAACCAIVAIGLARNLALTGTWQGGNTKTVLRPIWFLLRPIAFSACDMLIGDSRWLKPPLSSPAALVAVSTVVLAVAACALVAWPFVARGSRPFRPHRWTPIAIWLGVYCAGMCYVALTSVISFGVRMFVPALPWALLIFGAALTAWDRRARGPEVALGRSLLVTLSLSYAAINVASLTHYTRISPHEVVADALERPMSNGQPLSTWIESFIPRDAVLLSSEGQPTGYHLGRRTVSTVSRRYSEAEWTEDTTRSVMARFGATFLVVYPEALAGSEQTGPGELRFSPVLESPFFRELAAGRLPEWLEVAASNPRAIIFRRRQ